MSGLARILGRLGISQAGLAAELRLTRGAVHLKLLGRRPWHVDELLAVARVLSEPDRLERLGRSEPFTLDELAKISREKKRRTK